MAGWHGRHITEIAQSKVNFGVFTLEMGDTLVWEVPMFPRPVVLACTLLDGEMTRGTEDLVSEAVRKLVWYMMAHMPVEGCA